MSRTKRTKKAPNHDLTKNVNGMARTQNGPKTNFRPNLKDNGDKPPPWMMPKVNQDEEDPRGPTGQSIMGIYIHKSIIHQILSRRALRHSFGDTTQGPFLKGKY
ncbi:hypothetical protein O181_032613 [Austropuccinia psidii MF-1]|uniref:Uncharacterized protein n=1 Tax=Austropuccinia psidii MF-1 TaxID=1389203 RepID=A0A9Q3D1Y7_9BASI|nr:hypothetical protein [Austropuccinia psidii MF-1]